MSEGLNQYAVYRLKRSMKETRALRHQSYQYLTDHHLKVLSEYYDQLYLADFDPSLSPQDLRLQLEKELPAGITGLALDVSDVLAVTKGGISTAYYVDSEKLITLNSFFHVPASNAVLTPETTDFQIQGRPGVWLAAEDIWIDGRHFFLMQSQEFGTKAAYAVLDASGRPAAEDTQKGFTDEIIRQIRETIHQQTEPPSSASQKPHKPTEGIDADSEANHQKLQQREQGIRIKQSLQPGTEGDRPQPAPSPGIPVTVPPQIKNNTNAIPKKKKRRKGKVPLRLRSSILERLHKYQMKLASERIQAKNQM